MKTCLISFQYVCPDLLSISFVHLCFVSFVFNLLSFYLKFDLNINTISSLLSSLCLVLSTVRRHPQSAKRTTAMEASDSTPLSGVSQNNHQIKDIIICRMNSRMTSKDTTIGNRLLNHSILIDPEPKSSFINQTVLTLKTSIDHRFGPTLMRQKSVPKPICSQIND